MIATLHDWQIQHQHARLRKICHLGLSGEITYLITKGKGSGEIRCIYIYIIYLKRKKGSFWLFVTLRDHAIRRISPNSGYVHQSVFYWCIGETTLLIPYPVVISTWFLLGSHPSALICWSSPETCDWTLLSDCLNNNKTRTYCNKIGDTHVYIYIYNV